MAIEYPSGSATPPQVSPKDPAEVELFVFDWTDALAGDTIATSDWTVPAGITEDATADDDTTTRITLSGGTDGLAYEVSCSITTAGGRQLKRSMIVVVDSR